MAHSVIHLEKNSTLIDFNEVFKFELDDGSRFAKIEVQMRARRWSHTRNFFSINFDSNASETSGHGINLDLEG